LAPQGSPAPESSAQIPQHKTEKQQVNPLRLPRTPNREPSQVTYTEHAQELDLHRAHTATGAVTQRAAIADWIYWQHLNVLMSDAVAESVS
jgi:hypothetical protein